MSEEDDIRRLGRTMRQLFIEEKSRALKRPYKPAPRHDKAEYFQKAAKTCIDLKADPSDVIQAAFRYCRMKGGPFANNLCGPALRGWYEMHMQALGIQPGRKQQTVVDGKTVEEIIYACDMDLKMDIAIVKSMFWHKNKTMDPRDPRNLEMLRDEFVDMVPSVRATLGGFDAQVLTTFGKEICEYFDARPNYRDAAERLGYPLQETLKWIRTWILKRA